MWKRNCCRCDVWTWQPGVIDHISCGVTQNKLLEGMGVVWTRAGTVGGTTESVITSHMRNTPAASTWVKVVMIYDFCCVKECGSSWKGFTLLLERWWMILILMLSKGPQRSARQNHWEIWLNHMIVTCCPECSVSLVGAASRSCRGSNCCWIVCWWLALLE